MARKATSSRRETAPNTEPQKTKRTRTASSSSAQERSTGRRKPPARVAAHTAGEGEPVEDEAVRTPPTEPAPGAAPTRLEATAKVIGRTLGRTTAAITGHLPWTRGGDGLDLLERDHRRLEALLEEGVNTDATAERTDVLMRIARELTLHEQIEEKVLYPALKPHADARDIVLEGYQEHHVADLVLEELKALPPSDERWGAKLKVLKENIEHHIEEEEGEMFKTARSVLSREQLTELGARMEAMKQELRASAGDD